MENIKSISKRADLDQRIKILDQETFSSDDVIQEFLQRADEENLSDSQAIKLINYMNSSDFFTELEAYHFYLYDRSKLSKWKEVLNHVYLRSISPLCMAQR